MLKSEILTPALLLDLDAFEANLARMMDQVKRSGKSIRPHAKAHKCVEIAKRQLAAGAIGVCVATLAEAELMASAGITGILLTSPVADPAKIARIVKTGAMVAVDHVKQVEWYQDAAKAADRNVDMLIDLDVGDHRTGASSTAQALEIADAIARSSHLKLRGVQGYSGKGSHLEGEESVRLSGEVWAHAIEVRDALAKRGMATDIVSGGSTGTWQIDTKVPNLTEMQAGSFVLMDLEYRRSGVDFRQVITVLGTVVSANHDTFVTTDAGIKSFSTDRGFPPEAAHLAGLTYRFGGDEFGYLNVDDPAKLPRLGDKIEFIPPHCDPTVNLYTFMYACRGDRVEAVWPVKSLTV
ncbi:MAG: DSD1 family PLP-dependent enzyme [Acidobacteriota bacterium]